MDLDSLKKELGGKQRTLNDLHRFITTRNDNNPNYSLLLGAGCSVTSNIRSASELISQWRREVYENYCGENINYDENKAINYLSSNHSNWYNQSNEYSSLFEKKYDLPKQRRMFVEHEVSGKLPSLGYAYLANLVSKTYFNTIFTTNFDDIINEAFYQFTNTRPIVCAHDTSIKSITVTSKRPKIIKLHGDYLFDDIKSTLRETESLEENIRNKLIEFLKDYGLIVVGYSGNDRSIMDVLNYLLKQEDYLKNGIYWCLRKGDQVSEELRKLLWKDKVYYVDITGFDELFAEIFKKINGNKLPINTNFVSSKAQDIVTGFLNNHYLTNSTSAIIQEDLKELEKYSKRNHYVDILKQVEKNNEKDSNGDGYSDKEFFTLMDLRNKINQGTIEEAIKFAQESLAKFENNKFKIDVYDLLIRANLRLERYDDAINLADKIIDVDQRNPMHILNKADLLTSNNEKLQLIEMAIQKDPHLYRSYYEKAEILMVKYFENYKHDLFDQIRDTLEIGIRKDPSIRNPCWSSLYDFVIQARMAKKEKIEIAKKIIEKLSDQNPFSSKVLAMKMRLLILEDKLADQKESLLSEILDAKNSSLEALSFSYDLLYLRVLDKLNEKRRIEIYLSSMDGEIRYKRNIDYLKTRATMMVSNFDDIDGSINALQKALELETDPDVIEKLIDNHIAKGNLPEAEKIYDKYSSFLGREQKIMVKKDMYEAKDDYESALRQANKLRDFSPDKHILIVSYLYILMNDYKRAKEITREFLSSINFNVYAGPEIINYELSSSLLSKDYKINKTRLQEVYDLTESHIEKAAVMALLGNRDEAFKLIQKGIEQNNYTKYTIKNWPVFKPLANDPRWKQIYSSQVASELKLAVAQDG